jgi:hypothetical protein
MHAPRAPVLQCFSVAAAATTALGRRARSVRLKWSGRGTSVGRRTNGDRHRHAASAAVPSRHEPHPESPSIAPARGGRERWDRHGVQARGCGRSLRECRRRCNDGHAGWNPKMERGPSQSSHFLLRTPTRVLLGVEPRLADRHSSVCSCESPGRRVQTATAVLSLR